MADVKGNGPVFQEAVAAQVDTAPPLDVDTSFQEEAPYGYTAGGRIRKRPVAERVSTRTAPSDRQGKVKGNEKLAEDATAVLCNLNGFIGLGFGAVGLTGTSSVWFDGQDTFKAQTQAALENDPALCRQILKAGTTGGKMGLALAYGMLLASILPMAIGEAKEKQDAKRAAQEELSAGG